MVVAKVNEYFLQSLRDVRSVFWQLPENHYVDKVDALLSYDVNSTYEQSTDTECADVK